MIEILLVRFDEDIEEAKSSSISETAFTIKATIQVYWEFESLFFKYIPITYKGKPIYVQIKKP